MASCCFTRNKLPKVPTNLSVPRTRSAGHAQQVRAAARKKTQRAQPTFPPHRLARQGTPSRSGRQPAKGPKGPTNLSTPPTRPAGQTQQVRAAARKNPKGLTSLSTQPTRPAGHASQSSAGRSRRKRIKSCFDRLRRPKHTSHPESAGFAGAVRGASPNFGRGLPPSRQLDTPVLCPPERRQIPGAPPKIPHSTLFSASTISKSRSFLRAVRFTAKEKTTVSTAAHR